MHILKTEKNSFKTSLTQHLINCDPAQLILPHHETIFLLLLKALKSIMALKSIVPVRTREEESSKNTVGVCTYFMEDHSS